MEIKRILSVILIFFFCTAGYAQLKYADQLYEEYSYADAAFLYEKLYKKDSTDTHVIQRLGNCYQKLNKYSEAEKFFAKAVKDPKSDPDCHLHYGQLLKNQNKIRQARNQFELFLNHHPESLLGKLLLQSCDDIGKWTSQPSEFQMKNLKAINTEYIEIAPFPIAHKLVFTSDKNYISKDDKVGKYKKGLDGLATNIYVYDSTDLELPIRSISENVNNIDDIEGPAYISKDGKQMAYTKVYDRQRNQVNQIELYISTATDGVWSKGESFKHNNKKYGINNPVYADNLDLYFSSDMSGGFGSWDIYYCAKTEDGYATPVNLGGVINTEGIESPSFIDENGILYFSSNFHPGFGGMDVFKSKNVNGEWSAPENLKVPFNSTKDELGFIMTDSVTGYFSSNRDGGKGLDDIYFFTKIQFSDSSYYTDISGVFVFDTLPMINMSLTLLDENDEIIQSLVTDDQGRFTFKNVPANVTYKILINEEPEKVPDEAKIYLTNDRYDKIMLIERLQKGLFKFEALERDEYDGLSLMDEVDDYGLPTLTIMGQLESNQNSQDLNHKKVYIVDDNGNILASTFTDHLGKFNFEKLSIDNQYLFQLEEDDANIDIRIINKKGELIGRTMKNKDGVYVYHKFTINPSNNPDLRGVFKFGNLPADGIMLMLLDENDDIVQTTVTNIKGEFEFSGLVAGTQYKIQVDSTIKVPGNSSLFLMDKHTGMLVPVSKLANGTFRFETLSPIPPEELALMEEEDYVIKPRNDIRGQVYHSENKIIPAGLIVQILDENGRVVALAKTNEKGMFKFFNLPTEDQYLFNIPEDDQNFAIRILNDDAKVIGEAKRNSKNEFVYHKFTINPSKRPDVRGLFKYGNLPANDVSLNLLDDNDEIVQFTQTNAQGEFSFKQLYAGKNYRVEVDKKEGQIPDNAVMYIMDQYTGLMLPVSRLNNGQFQFETLGMMEPEELKLVEEQDDRIARFSFFAHLFSKLPMDLPEGLEISIVDDDGNIIATARTDRFGKFNYQELPLQDQYLLKIAEDDPNYELKIISKDGNLIGVLKRNKKGEFVFNRDILYQEVAEVDKNKITKEEPVKSKPVNLPTSGEFNPTISFGFDGYKLNDNIRKNLDHVVNAMNKEKAIKLEINSHTDSRGPAEYNLWLSKERGDNVKLYLTNNGISSDRIIVNSFGETKLLNECSDDVNCTNEQHAINRRVELKYIR